jgi:hypothetical protein
MRYISVDELRSLIGRSEPCVSVYAPLTGDREKDHNTLQDLLNQATERARAAFPMVSLHFREISASEVLKNVDHEGQWSGIVVFKSLLDERFHPIEVSTTPLVVVSDSFHLRPLFSKLQTSLGYIAIRLERDRVQMFRGNNDEVSLVRQFLQGKRSPNLLKDDRFKEPLSAGGERRYTNAARRMAQMQLDRTTLRFYREADKDIRRSMVRDEIPVILVGEDRLISLYKSVNRHRSALIGSVTTSDGTVPSAEEIQKRALELLEDIHRRQALFGAVEFRYTRGKGRAIDNLSRIAEAAAQGQIKSLLIRAGTNIWGRVFRTSGRVQLDTLGANPMADDVLDDIGEMVLKHKGQVFVLKSNEMPTAEPAAAVLVPRTAV